MVVVDTSVLVKWFLQENHSDEALLLRDALRDGLVRGACPDFALVELGNVLRYKFPVGDVDRTKASVRSVTGLGMKVIASSPGIVSDAIGLAYAHDLAVYDAIFVALARDLGYPLVTADEALIARTAALGFVVHIRDWRIVPKGP